MGASFYNCKLHILIKGCFCSYDNIFDDPELLRCAASLTCLLRMNTVCKIIYYDTNAFKLFWGQSF